MMVLRNLQNLLRSKGYQVFSRPNELNIVGIRSKDRTPDTFDDEFFVFWYDGSNWLIRHYKGTTDPGTYFLQNPLWKRGTVIVKEGQYLNCWSIGKHKGKYEALVQTGPIRVLVDANRDAILDLEGATEENGQGINLHRARLDGRTVEIRDWSAGCQVLADSAQFAELIGLAKRHANLYGKLSYSLIDLRDYRAQQFKEVVIGGLIVGGLLLIEGNVLPNAWQKIKNWLYEDEDD